MNLYESNGLVSADSHVMESPDLWVNGLPPAFRDAAPRYAQSLEASLQAQPGGRDPAKRIEEMAQDNVCAEVLYPSLLMDQFRMQDPALQEACFRVYNDWLIEYCSYAPTKLFGIAAISAYNIDNAIAELRRCREAGLRGIMVWQVPPKELAFSTKHHDRLWAAAQEAAMPVSLHIRTGVVFTLGSSTKLTGVDLVKQTVNEKLHYAADALAELLISGTFQRFPGLQIVFVENEVSWLPFYLSQYDKYCARKNSGYDLPLSPSEYFRRQVHTTFFNDPPSGLVLKGWGEDNCLWSNDFPHPNSTWPNSREVIERDLGDLSPAAKDKVLSANARALYHLPALEKSPA